MSYHGQHVGFMGFRREVRIIFLVIHKFPEMKLEREADLNSGPVEH